MALEVKRFQNEFPTALRLIFRCAGSYAKDVDNLRFDRKVKNKKKKSTSTQK